MAPALRNRSSWTFLFYFFCYFFAGVSCLKCLQCSNHADENCFLGTTPAKECPNKNHTYCITFSGYIKETRDHRLFRNCTQSNLTNECLNLPLNVTGFNLDGVEMKVCYYTCETDGCNTDVHELAANMHYFSPPLIIINVLFVCAIFFA